MVQLGSGGQGPVRAGGQRREHHGGHVRPAQDASPWHHFRFAAPVRGAVRTRRSGVALLQQAQGRARVQPRDRPPERGAGRHDRQPGVLPPREGAR